MLNGWGFNKFLANLLIIKVKIYKPYLWNE